MPTPNHQQKPWAPSSEADLLAPCIAKWEHEDDLVVHQERQIVKGGPVADAVLIRESTGEVHAIEAKLHFNLRVAAQAFRHCQSATSWWVVVPARSVASMNEPSESIRDMLSHCRTGVITVAGPEIQHVRTWLDVKGVSGPAFADASTVAEIAASIPKCEAGTQTAGSAGGGRESAEASLVAEVRALAAEQPGSKLNHLMRQIKHRWPTDRAACNEVKRRLKSSSGPTRMRVNQSGVVEVLDG